MTGTKYLDALEFDLAGNVGRVHAVACYDGIPWPATACGLPGQAYPSTGTEWGAVQAARRCRRCADALGAPGTIRAKNA